MVNYTRLQDAFHTYDSLREKVIKQGRVVLKLSKQVIYALHRDEMDAAQTRFAELEEAYKALVAITQEHPKLPFEGSVKVAVQEYVEAALYLSFVEKGELIELDVDPEHYVLGIADLPGELVRRAVYLAGKGQYDQVEKIRNVIDELYGALLGLDPRQNEVRRKIDGIKYDLRKLEDILLDVKLRQR